MHPRSHSTQPIELPGPNPSHAGARRPWAHPLPLLACLSWLVWGPLSACSGETSRAYHLLVISVGAMDDADAVIVTIGTNRSAVENEAQREWVGDGAIGRAGTGQRDLDPCGMVT